MYVKTAKKKKEKLPENKNVTNMLDNNLQPWIHTADSVTWINQKLFSYWYLLVTVVVSHNTDNLLERVAFVRIRGSNKREDMS